MQPSTNRPTNKPISLLITQPILLHSNADEINVGDKQLGKAEHLSGGRGVAWSQFRFCYKQNKYETI